MSPGATPNVRLEGAGACPVLFLRDRVSITDAQQLHALTVQSLTAGVDVQLDATSLERLDAAALQVLVALRRALQQQGRTLLVRPPAEGPVAAVLGWAGLLSGAAGTGAGAP